MRKRNQTSSTTSCNFSSLFSFFCSFFLEVVGELVMSGISEIDNADASLRAAES